MKTINLNTWKRNDIYRFFKDYERPFFNICTEFDVTGLYRYTKRNGGTFFLHYLYAALKAANEVEEFRYRLQGQQVVLHDVIHGGSTVLMADETFRFWYFRYDINRDRFLKHESESLAQFKSGAQPLEPQDNRDDLIHFSVIPWFRFSSVSHPRRADGNDSIPKIVFGKATAVGESMLMPISIAAHHALMDAYHVAQFLQRLQQSCNHPEW